MKNLFDSTPECSCGGAGVIVTNARFSFCGCAAGARERQQDTSGYGKHIGRLAAEVVTELQQQLVQEIR